MVREHCYLFALEVKPLNQDIYEELPPHCTLIHRFQSNLEPMELIKNTQNLFEKISPITLIAEEHLKLGPKQVAVSELQLTRELKSLHKQLYELLNQLEVKYTEPDWVGEGYRAHITERPDFRLELKEPWTSLAAYLIEVKVPGYDHKRIIRHKFNFKTDKTN